MNSSYGPIYRDLSYLLTDAIRDAIFVGAGNAFAKESRTMMKLVEVN